MKTIRTLKRRRAFIRTIEAGGSVLAACRGAGMSKSAAFSWRNADVEFAAAWDAAIECGTETLEDEAVRRALAGSDVMMIFLLKSRRPSVYREPRTLALHGVADAPPIEIGPGRVCIYLPHDGRSPFKPDD